MTKLTAYGYERLEANLPAITFGEAYRYNEIGNVMLFEDCRQASLYLDTGNYFTLQCLFGHAFMIGILKYFETVEDYERCSEIKKAIEEMNRITKLNLPTNDKKNS